MRRAESRGFDGGEGRKFLRDRFGGAGVFRRKTMVPSAIKQI